MSGIRDTATVTLNVNGAQAKQMMADIEAKIKQTEATIDSLKKSMADPGKIEKAKKELKSYKTQLDEMRSATEGVSRALENIELATPRQLEKAIRTLNRQLKDMVPGSDVWDSHCEKIRELKTRLSELKEGVNEQKSTWNKFREWSVSAWPALELLKGWYDTLIGTMRQYVDAYAGMEQEMANVRKFTGMTEAEVASLNEQFRSINTRSSREELNKLAQEAGRLGKTSEEDVLGFVRAADKINVALDDLGQGATLTLSKLTGVFGDERRYGTEQALLRVGSVINELSQNCAASAPYLADFASRLGGVGSQAGMTIQQIMGFGAVLDANGQAVESSATALSQIIVRLYQEPAKYAKVAGLDVKEFSELMRRDANSALVLFLETLHNAGGMDVLSPMFKDMGENGSRAVAALSTLATHIDEVKAQQEAANVAFAEGTSIDKEFAVQNNTVQASLDKAKNRANELRVELGERLYPLMGHLIISGTAILQSIITLVKWIDEYKGYIISTAVAIGAYTLVVNAAAIATAAETAVTKAAVAAKMAIVPAVALAKAAYFALTGQTRKATVAMRAFNSAVKLSPIGLFVGAVALAAGAIITYGKRASATAAEQRRLNREQQKYLAGLRDITQKTAEYSTKEISSLDKLYKAATNEALGKQKRVEAAKTLINQYPEYFQKMSTEMVMVGQAQTAYDNLRESILKTGRARAAQDKIVENEKERLDLELQVQQDKIVRGRQVRDVERTSAEADAAYRKNGGNLLTASGGMQLTNPVANQAAVSTASASANYQAAKSALAETDERIASAEKRIADLAAANDDLSKIAESVTLNLKKDATVPPGTEPSDADGNEPETVRFANEKAWRERQEAEARIAYVKGEVTYAQHTTKMNKIAVDYYQKLLNREDVVGDERLSIQADYWDAVNKQTNVGNQQKIDDENNWYNETIYKLNESLRVKLSAVELSAKDRETAEKVHREAVELAELSHLARLVELYKEGSAERLRAQQAYQTAQLNAQKRHQQEYEKQEAEFAKYKEKFFGDTPSEKQQKYDAAFESLKVVYDREIAAAGDNAAEKLRIEEAFLQAQNELRRQYGLQSEEDTRNAMERGVAASADWLNGDGGKAITGTISTLTQGMSSIFSGLSTMIQAELEVQTASINKRYDREIQAAQGNSYKVAKLEKKKEAEIAKAKNEANKKLFAMQVIQAVAQTAQNALAAYGSAAQVPVVGYILAPIAAAMAVAAGAIQIAAIKKQQQASEAQGYSQGGFTKPGGVNEPAGIVHAGEWVASQKLLANPVARPMIEALDYAQRTNTIGSLRPDDVSRSITANNSLVRISESDNGSRIMAAVASQMSVTVAHLTDRLNEPFVTINTVTGDHGIQQAQDDYAKLMNNITPKSKRKKS